MIGRELLIGGGAAVAAFLIYLGYNVWPLVLLGALFFLVTQLVGTGGLRRRVAPVGAGRAATHVTFKDVGGQAAAKRELIEALEFLSNAEFPRRLGIRPLRGILLTGPPGTGKTLLAKAAATYTDSVFLAASGSEFVEMYAGVGAQRIREIFARARRQALDQSKSSAIVFIDELEVLGGQRGRHMSHLEYDQTLNQLLVEMDGITWDDKVNILVMGATNRADLLDQALLRPGRFDRLVRVDLPDREGRLQILELHTRNKPLAPDADLEQIAKQTHGFSGAHLESVANEAAILAMRAGSDRISQSHLQEAVDKVLMGEKVDRRPCPEDLERVSAHEVGHAVMAEIVRPGSVSSVSISSRGQTLGHVRQTPRDDAYLQTRRSLEEEIDVLLAGAVAEEELYGDRSTGAACDFEQAAELARRMVLAGMSPLGVIDKEVVPNRLVHREVTRTLGRRERAVRRRLRRHKQELRRVASRLLERESLSGDELRRYLGSNGRRRGPARRREAVRQA